MALNRQRILNELGSVVNQLQSADCGCMDKLFGSTEQAPAPPNGPPICGGSRGGCCHGHGYGYNPSGSCCKSNSNNTQNMYGSCMGRCNPPKLYDDTYNYLTENLMQPTVKEVYNDLRSLTPANTVVNNSMANQMVSQTGQQIGGILNQHPTNYQNNAGDAGKLYNNIVNRPANATTMLTNEPNQISQMGGMGPQIMNMLGGNMSKQNDIIGQKDLSMTETHHSPHNQIGFTPLSMPMKTNQNAYNANVQNHSGNHNVNQNITQPNLQPGRNTATRLNSHGQHSQGIAKFNEMFPGVMKGLGGDLDFDPMTIALQMNPANQQQTAINTMHKMMQNNDINKVFDQSANVNALRSGTGATHANTSLPNAEQYQGQNNVPPNEVQQSSPAQQATNVSVKPNMTPTNRQTYPINANFKDISHLHGSANSQVNNQKVYVAGSGEYVPNDQSYVHTDQQLLPNSLQYQPQYIINPNTNNVIASPTLPAVSEAVTGQRNIISKSPNVQEMIKERVLPTDTSRNIANNYEFNTLGQPVEMLSAKIYRTPEPSLPQTLSPQPTANSKSNPAKYSKVKATVSKTSLMGINPIGRTPSRLQQIYNQYKGSQSYTKQNIAPSAVNAVTHSEGKLNTPQISSPPQQMHLERIAGDTLYNNKLIDDKTIKLDPVKRRMGDVPAPNVICDGENHLLPEKVIPAHNRKCRNGLQDIVYTSYPSSTAWSFHGAKEVPISAGYRYFKNK